MPILCWSWSWSFSLIRNWRGLYLRIILNCNSIVAFTFYSFLSPSSFFFFWYSVSHMTYPLLHPSLYYLYNWHSSSSSSSELTSFFILNLYLNSISQDFRSQMIKCGLVPKLTTLLRTPAYRARTLKLLYHISADEKCKAMITYTVRAYVRLYIEQIGIRQIMCLIIFIFIFLHDL